MTGYSESAEPGVATTGDALVDGAGLRATNVQNSGKTVDFERLAAGKSNRINRT